MKNISPLVQTWSERSRYEKLVCLELLNFRNMKNRALIGKMSYLLVTFNVNFIVTVLEIIQTSRWIDLNEYQLDQCL